jgi:gliding motility-associated-like protein
MRSRFPAFLIRLLVCLMVGGLGMGGRAVAQDVSGFWLGVVVLDDSLSRVFSYTTTLTQSGALISGTAQTADPSLPFGGKATVSGRFANNRLTFQEANQRGTRNDKNICYFEPTLTYDPAAESLKGTFVNIYNPPYCNQRGGGTMELYRIQLKSGTTYCPNVPVTLQVTGRNIRWYDSPQKTRLLATGNAYAAGFSQITTLYVTQTVYNVESPAVPVRIQVLNQTDPACCQNSADCSDRVYLPTAFSPNGDGLNDVLTVFSSIPKLTLNSFTVFDRWGSVVFHRDAASIANGEALWDGGGAPEGTYVYTLDVQLPSSGRFTYHGAVTVVR